MCNPPDNSEMELPLEEKFRKLLAQLKGEMKKNEQLLLQVQQLEHDCHVLQRQLNNLSRPWDDSWKAFKQSVDVALKQIIEDMPRGSQHDLLEVIFKIRKSPFLKPITPSNKKK